MSDEGAACGTCKKATNSTWFCRNCIQPLCEICYQSHVTDPLLKEHLVVKNSLEALKLYGPSRIAEPCDIHPNKEISAYCNTCCKPCCISCLVDKHQTHSFSTIEDKYMATEKALYTYIKEVQQMIEQIEDALKKLLHKERMNIEVKKDINDLKERLKQAVDKSFKYLLNLLNTSDSVLDYVNRELYDEKSKIDQLIRDVDRKISEGKFGIIKYSPPTLSSILSDILMPNHNIPSFLANIELLRQIESKIGTLSFNEIEISKVKNLTLQMKVKSINYAGNSSAWVTHNKNDTMHLLTTRGLLTKSIKITGCKGLNDIAITKSGEIIVTCTDHKVRYLDRNGIVSKIVDSGHFEPEGVCLSNKEDVVVCMRGCYTKNHLAVYPPDGNSQGREIRGVDSQGKPQITFPLLVVCNGTDFCVVNEGSNVLCVDDSDQVIWVYDGSLANHGRTFRPNGICVDKYHNLFITDFKNIHHVGRNGELIQVILTEQHIGLWYPRGICVDEEGSIWIISPEGEVVICKYLK